MNGVLVVDKPQGLTSHDVVASARRALDNTKVGHTGTLDPLATGVLPLVLGRATRLVRFFAASDKDYDATIRFGLSTDTYDITGHEVGRTDTAPSRDDVIRSLHALTGEYLQTPPAYSAKKVQGRRAYEMARGEHEVVLTPVAVRVVRADLVDFSGIRARVILTCSAGFYVRSFAHTLGELAGTGACLEALRRTRSGEFGLAAAVQMEDLGNRERVVPKLIPASALLCHLPAVTITDRARENVLHGREIDSTDYFPAPFPLSLPEPGTRNMEPQSTIADPRSPMSAQRWIRLIDSAGSLVGMATSGSQPGSLHPSLVLM